MRKEATLEQWKELYDAATCIHEMAPWEHFWDQDVFEIVSPDHGEVYISIMGRNGGCYGISVFEGEEGLNAFYCMLASDEMGMREGQAILHAQCLTCYWGDRQELSQKQRQRIKDLGLHYRGHNAWLYFMSFLPGYLPYDMDADEVSRMTQYMRELQKALEAYDLMHDEVPFYDGSFFRFEILKSGTFEFGPIRHPNRGYQISMFHTDEDILEELHEKRRVPAILEVEERILASSIQDKKYERPAAMRLVVVADAKTGFIYDAQISEPDDQWPVTYLAAVVVFIMNNGLPKEIHVPDEVARAALIPLCEDLDIVLKQRDAMPAVDAFFEGAPF